MVTTISAVCTWCYVTSTFSIRHVLANTGVLRENCSTELYHYSEVSHDLCLWSACAHHYITRNHISVLIFTGSFFIKKSSPPSCSSCTPLVLPCCAAILIGKNVCRPWSINTIQLWLAMSSPSWYLFRFLFHPPAPILVVLLLSLPAAVCGCI